MSQINRVPWGLQSLLGSQNFGKNPGALNESVQPTLDQLPFLGYETLQCDADYVAGATIVGDKAELTIPDNEAWAVLGVAGDIRLTAGVEYTLNVLYVWPANAGGAFLKFHALGYMVKRDGAGLGYGASTQFPIPVVFGPGTRFENVIAEQVGLVACDIRLSVMYYRLDV